MTRVRVRGRLLNLRIPLRLLRAPSFDDAVWDRLCARWSRALRFYAEPVYLFEA